MVGANIAADSDERSCPPEQNILEMTTVLASTIRPLF